MSTVKTTIEELEKKWDAFADVFAKNIEPQTKITAYNMLSTIRLREAHSVLEVGCGAGGIARLAHPFLNKDSKFVLTDLSPNMLTLTKAKLYDLHDPTPIIEPANLQDLKYADGSFDRVYGNYVIHLVPDPDLALQQVFRVLEKGGIAAFSVWGRPENSPKFTIPDLAKKSATQNPSFHLHDSESLRQRVLKAGFTKALAYYITEPTDYFDGKEFAAASIENPPTAAWLKTIDEEKRKEYFNTIAEEGQKILDSGKPISTESLVVIAFK